MRRKLSRRPYRARVRRRGRRERAIRFRRRAAIAAAVLLLAALAMTPQLRRRLAQAAMRSVSAVQAFALPQSAQTEITLEGMRIYAVQLGAFDNGEHAQREMDRLLKAGVPTVIWQREQMRLICSAALTKVGLDVSAAQGQDAWVIGQELDEVTLRVESGAAQLEAAHTLLTAPDLLLKAICEGKEPLSDILGRAKPIAQRACGAHPEQLLYTQLAQSLVNWCELMEQMLDSVGEETARHYASATMALLCDELRQALQLLGAQSAESTASAQRTPSTAAEVIPPA